MQLFRGRVRGASVLKRHSKFIDNVLAQFLGTKQLG